MTVPSPTEFIRKAQRAAHHFGFRPVADIKKNNSEARPKRQTKIAHAERKLDALHGLLTAGASHYFDSLGGTAGPQLFLTIDEIPRTGDVAVGLHIIGVEKSIAEALLIHTLRSLLSDLGYERYSVKINSLGDRESVARYARELTNFLRKRIEDIPREARDLLRQHPFNALLHLIENNHELSHRSPSPLEYLSDGSRRHFREIVEYLEMTNAVYEIDTRLVGHHQCYSDAIFSIELSDEAGNPLPDAPITIRGGRYDEFVRRVTKENVPATGAVIVLKAQKRPSRMPRAEKGPAPSVFVVQLGFGPKIKSLMLLEDLRHARINAYQELASDSISDQLRKAESYNVRHSLILGQKEFVEGTVIIRDMFSRSQESIPSLALIPHLKKLVRAR